ALSGLAAAGRQEDALTATLMNNLGDVLRMRSKYLDAEPFLRQALAIREKIFGKDHIDASESYIALGALYTDRREYSRAIPLLQRALLIRERGSRPELVVMALSTLAATHIYCRRYREADEFLQRALVITNRVDPRHPKLA